jgi:hypothetical protein
VHPPRRLRTYVKYLRAITHQRFGVREELEEIASVQVADLATYFVAGTGLARLSTIREAWVVRIGRMGLMALTKDIIQKVIVGQLPVLTIIRMMQSYQMCIFMAIVIDVEWPIIQHLIDTVHMF